MSPPPPTGTTIASSFGRGREQLERDRALARDDQRIVERGHEPRAGSSGDRLRVRERGRVVVAFELDPRAVMRGVRDLRERCVGRHHDRRRDAEQSRVIRDALRVVPGRGRDHAERAGFGRQVREEVAGAALLERAGELLVLELHPEIGARDLRQRLRVQCRRRRPPSPGSCRPRPRRRRSSRSAAVRSVIASSGRFAPRARARRRCRRARGCP